MILNSMGNEILRSLSPEQYRIVLKCLEDAILATDLAVYFRKRGAFFRLVESGTWNWSTPEHRDMLRGMLMTACDIAAITKPWSVQRRVSIQYNQSTLQVAPLKPFVNTKNHLTAGSSS
jgi:hypothetical protein